MRMLGEEHPDGLTHSQQTDQDLWKAFSSYSSLSSCVRGEGAQGVLTLFCSGAAQVCHDDGVVELKEQLEVEEEDGDKQEEKVEEKGEVESRRVRHGWK